MQIEFSGGAVDLRIVGGAILLAFGVAETIWAVSAHAPRRLVAQGMFFIEFGLFFLVIALLPSGIMRNSLGTVLALSALISLAIQWKLMHAERREGTSREERKPT